MAATNPHAKSVLESWAAGEWFLSRPAFPAKLVLKVFKVDGEINTDDFSPAGHAPTRPDIPLHAQSMGQTRFPGGNDLMKKFREEGHRVAFVGDVVGTGSSRKSACNSLMWHIGEDIPFVPNKRRAGVVIGGLIAPIFFNTTEDSGGLPLMADVTRMKTGDIITLDFTAGVILDAGGRKISKLAVKPADAQGRVPGRRPPHAHHRPPAHGQGPQGARPRRGGVLHRRREPRAQAGPGLHAGPEDRRPRLRPRRASCPAPPASRT